MFIRKYQDLNEFNTINPFFQCEQVLHALKAAAIGIGVLDGAVKTVSGIIGDMDTTIMFASAGTLNADNDGEEFAGMLTKMCRPQGIYLNESTQNRGLLS